MKYPKGIRPRGNKFFVDVTLNGVRKTDTCDTLADALKRQEELKQELMNAHPGDNQDSWNLEQAFQKTCELHWNPEQTKSSKKLQQNGRFVVEFFGPTTKLESITSDKVEQFAATLKEQGLSGATINRKLSALSKMMSVSFKRGKTGAKPVIERRKETAGRIRFISDEEEAAILKTLQLWSMQDVEDSVVVLVDTGMRPSELWKLHRRDIDVKRKLITIWQNKTDKPRSVPMTKRVIDVIKKRWDLGETMFDFDNFWFNRHWNKMKEHIGLSKDKEFIPYCLRHTCCSRLVQAGVNLKVVQEWMGHKSILTTMRYAHLSPKNLLDVVQVLEERKVG